MSEKKGKVRVVVAMSGGVDSSVAAALLVEQGFDVIGVMLRLWSEDTTTGGAHNRCCTPAQMNDARKIASKLGIPFYVLDAKQTFRNVVVQYFIDQYKQANTPNPCLECNRHIRFTFLLDNALALDADFLATGHYARVDHTVDGESQLMRGRDTAKDQSYVLSVLTQYQLRHALFPVGEYAKAEVRELAARFGLPTASKQDSQDLCFLGDGDYRRFLHEYAPNAMTPGPIVLKSGEIIGEHKGLANYTIGQRRGLNLSFPEPLYVLAMNPLRNTLVVGSHDDLGQSHLTANRMNWISGKPPAEPFRASAKIRYKSELAPALIEPQGADRITVHFDKPQRGIAPGQGAVVYTNDICLGGGIIER
jgi:tRNA-specific 2-thiouridylase